MIKCQTCGNDTVMRVGENNGIDFYSCCNEKCNDYAGLLVETNGSLQCVHDMLNAFKDVVLEIQNEKNKIR